MRLMCVVLLLVLMQSVAAPQQSATITLACDGTSKLMTTSEAKLKLDHRHQSPHHCERGQSNSVVP
jgi:hypothetical protein